MFEDGSDITRSIYPDLSKELKNWRYQPERNTLNGKNILVTGAGDGIGLSIAKTFSLYGANILLLGKTRSKLEDCFDFIDRILSVNVKGPRVCLENPKSKSGDCKMEVWST